MKTFTIRFYDSNIHKCSEMKTLAESAYKFQILSDLWRNIWFKKIWQGLRIHLILKMFVNGDFCFGRLLINSSKHDLLLKIHTASFSKNDFCENQRIYWCKISIFICRCMCWSDANFSRIYPLSRVIVSVPRFQISLKILRKRVFSLCRIVKPRREVLRPR